MDSTFYVVTTLRGKRRANICGFCGSRDECTIRLLLQSRSTRRRTVVAVSTCPSQPWAISWSRMSTATKANPCTNRPVNCPQCATMVWLYSVVAHFNAAHPNAPIPHHLCVPEEEDACVRKWDIGALKDSTKKQKVADTPTTSTTPFTNNATTNNTSSSSSSFSSYSTPPTTSHTPTMPPSESEATTKGDCRTRPLKSTGKRAKERKGRSS